MHKIALLICVVGFLSGVEITSEKIHIKLMEYGLYAITYEDHKIGKDFIAYTETGFHYITEAGDYNYSPKVVRGAEWGQKIGVQVIDYGDSGHLPLWYSSNMVIKIEKGHENDKSHQGFVVISGPGSNELEVKRIVFVIEKTGDLNEMILGKLPKTSVNSFNAVRKKVKVDD